MWSSLDQVSTAFDTTYSDAEGWFMRLAFVDRRRESPGWEGVVATIALRYGNQTDGAMRANVAFHSV